MITHSSRMDLRRGCPWTCIRCLVYLFIVFTLWRYWTFTNTRLPSASNQPRMYSFYNFFTDVGVQVSRNSSFDQNFAYDKTWVGFSDLKDINCNNMFGGSVRNAFYSKSVSRTPVHVIAEYNDCRTFRERFGFNRYPVVSIEETLFPIGFILLFNKDIDQVLFLLRAIYRPHNVYCLNVDAKSEESFIKAATKIAKCVPNVILASRLESIVYAGFTRLQADINCMKDLLKHPVSWKYVINMPGQQFPLRTNLEMVKILQKYKGANDIEGITGRRMLNDRFINKYIYVTDENTGETVIKKTKEKAEPPPHGFRVVKGSAYGTFSRAFVSFVIHDTRAQSLLEWSRQVKSPDEYYWATLHHSKVVPVPGSFSGNPNNKPWLTVYASWGGGNDPCATIRKRAVCIFSPEDIPRLMERHEFFANKFYITHYPSALHCLDQMLFNLTASGQTRNLTFYDSLPFIPKQ